MRDEDGLAVEIAAERRRADEAERREFDARRVEVPRTLREDARERWRWWRSLGRRVLRAVMR